MATRKQIETLRQHLHTYGDREQVAIVDEVLEEHYTTRPAPPEDMPAPETIGPVYEFKPTAGEHYHWVLGKFKKGAKTKKLDGVYLVREDGTILGAGVNVSDGQAALYSRVAKPSKP